MCRILILLNQLPLQYINKFLLQSVTNKNTPGLENNRDFNFHLDGYGFIFYYNNKISIYKSSLLYKNDLNFNFIKEKFDKSNIIIGHIRATKTEFIDNICYNNTHPFWFENNYWCHNGSISPFEEKYFLQFINQKYKKSIKGNTDSEILFYIFLSIKDKVDNIEKTWNNFFELLSQFKSAISANIVYCNDNYIYISRFINNDEIPPSLYFDNKLMIISSEPISDNYTLLQKNIYLKYNIQEKILKIVDFNYNTNL